ncbi:hypothetical protein LR48_Vigan10g179100 [Vigna angularis]|uniref:Uncharacterized protein n=1 Tax=Phaseolus angularis TaxID=3914 RepID=A0A0L9VMC9_PHAAN|nr:hypothetical protein LR48_Vigan10g179100 [Vigna angularis]
MVGYYDLFFIDHLSKDERLCASAITWILLPRSEDQSILTTEDVYLLHALRTKIQTTWAFVIGDHMIKVTRQNEYHLLYVVLISRVLRFHGVDVTNEMTIGCTKTNVTEKLFLDHMGLRRNENGWSYKDGNHLETEEVEPINVDTSRYQFKPQTDFARLVVDQFIYMTIRCKNFENPSLNYTKSEKNSVDEKLLEKSDSE